MCTSDSACTAGSDGRCIESGGGIAYCTCTYDTCTGDSACPSDQTCACHGAPYAGGAGNTCVPGNCRVDGDCGAGGYCSPSYLEMSCGALAGYYCHTPKDQCVNDSDCTGSNGPGVCVYTATDGRWECQMQELCALANGGGR
jgi:hypothetical protein